MATHDYVIDNSTGANVRADLNLVLQAILSNNSSSSAPSTTAAYMFWADTTTGTLKIRNSSDNAWVELLQLDGTLTLEDGTATNPALAFRDDLNTGIFSSGANVLDIATGGVSRVQIDTSEITFNESGEDTDFRIEGDNNANLFFVDAGNNRIGIGLSSPDTLLHLAGADTAVIRLENTDDSLTANQIIGGLEFEKKDPNGAGVGVVGGLKMYSQGVVGENTYLTLSTSDSSTNNVERMRINADGRLGIGLTGPQAGLHVANENTTYGKNAVFGANGWVNSANYHYTDATISLLGQDADGNNKGAGVEFTARNSGNSNWNHGALYMERDGDFVLKANGAGNYVGTEKLRFQKNGGISFNGDTAAANALDDYEEGTWTASVNYGNHITTNAAYYTRIGNMVYWQLHFRPTFAPNDTSVYQIYGLPFTSKNVTENYGWTGNIVYTASANNSNIANMRPLVEKNNTYIYFHTVGLGSGNRVDNVLIRVNLVGHDTLMGGFYMAA